MVDSGFRVLASSRCLLSSGRSAHDSGPRLFVDGPRTAEPNTAAIIDESVCEVRMTVVT